ncbi:hypothetical protein [Nocardiopsis suaedae]|uniref:Uncharacterized protein n=1 Tax=Nocardiopsis suaedae TaxID=3018444 RepID=A0ABT4TFX7_9ACTN|nr:hypothetical protein [Nocardiopsis suaedae]MDA2803618.1 hypothetical protein [Nocardiopsis suaedae]
MSRRSTVAKALTGMAALLVLAAVPVLVVRPVVPADESHRDDGVGFVQLLSISSIPGADGVEVSWDVEFLNKTGRDLRLAAYSDCGPRVLRPWNDSASASEPTRVTVPAGEATVWSDACRVEQIRDRFFYELDLREVDGGSSKMNLVFTGLAPRP